MKLLIAVEVASFMAIRVVSAHAIAYPQHRANQRASEAQITSSAAASFVIGCVNKTKTQPTFFNNATIDTNMADGDVLPATTGTATATAATPASTNTQDDSLEPVASAVMLWLYIAFFLIVIVLAFLFVLSW